MNGVEVCEHHKRLLDAFTWEGRNERRWERINMSWLDDLIMKKADNLRNVPEDKFGEALGQAIREAVAEIRDNPQAVPEKWWEDEYIPPSKPFTIPNDGVF